MAGKAQYKTTDFINAIRGTGGIITTIAARVGCSWNTAKKYIDEHSTVKAAYDEEIERTIDKAEGVLLKNIDNAARLAQYGSAVVDTADVKWFLSRKAKTRGYVERAEVTGAGGDHIIVKLMGHDNG